MGALLKTTGYTVATLFVTLGLAIFVLSLPFSGWRALSVQTGSMRPAIGIGSLVLVHRVPATTLHIGDVITYNSKLVKGETITHRIVAFKQLGDIRLIVVKGDANKVPDPPLLPSQVIGHVVTVVPNVGKVIDFMHKPLGLALIVYIPSLLLIIYEFKVMTSRLTELEVRKRLKEQAKIMRTARAGQVNMPVTIHEHPPEKPRIQTNEPQPATPKPRQRKRTVDGFIVLTVLLSTSLSVTLGYRPTYSSLSSEVKLVGTTIKTKAKTQGTSCSVSTNSNNNVNISNTTSQSSSSGSTQSSSGSATSGNTSNNNANTIGVTINGNC